MFEDRKYKPILKGFHGMPEHLIIFDPKGIKRKDVPDLDFIDFSILKSKKYILGNSGQVFINYRRNGWEKILLYFTKLYYIPIFDLIGMLSVASDTKEDKFSKEIINSEIQRRKRGGRCGK